MPDAASDVLPALRPVELVDAADDDDGVRRVLLIDRSQFAPGALAISQAACAILMQLDGRRTLEEAVVRVEQRLGQRIPADRISAFVRTLDEALLLQTERFENAYAQRLAQHRRAGLRDNRQRYPDPDVLRAELLAIAADGVASPAGDVRGVVAPHLDTERGRPCYADAYAALAAAGPFDRYIILGTNHFGRAGGSVATASDFLTPLGRVRSDREFVEQLEHEAGGDLRRFELDHVAEHSVELQVHFLQAVQPDRPFSIVPLLCHYPCGPTGLAVADGVGPDLATLADALRRLIDADGRRTALIAGADLSHMGTAFGDARPADDALLEAVGATDRRLLALLARGQTDEFVEHIARFDNPTRICSPGCLYVVRRALHDCTSSQPRYHQAIDRETDTHVTCAAMVLTR